MKMPMPGDWPPPIPHEEFLERLRAAFDEVVRKIAAGKAVTTDTELPEFDFRLQAALSTYMTERTPENLGAARAALEEQVVRSG